MKTFILLVITLLVWTTTQANDSTTNKVSAYHIWLKTHSPKKVEYFLKGDTIPVRGGYMLVTKPKKLNKQIAYVEQGFYKHCSMRKIKRIFKRNCSKTIRPFLAVKI